jgi:glyoxylase-like metal-dependent hydrolase (beta-lactamase superfamily II)
LVKIEAFPMGVFQVNSYLLQCEVTGEIVIVDPGDEPEILVRRIRAIRGTPVAIWNTHGHIDHIAGNAAIRRAFDLPIFMHPSDRFLVDSFAQQAAMFGLDLESPPPPDHDLVPGEELTLGSCRLRILHVPGHSPGSVAFVHGRDAISGDALFAGSIGRTDLPGADLATLLRSIDDALVPLGDDMRIHPGHGPSTTIGEERRSNPFLRHEWRAQLLSERI